MPKVSLIITVFNEAHSIEELLKSISEQTRLPNETIVVDGGSTDNTPLLLKKAKKKFPTIGLKHYIHPSNRSAGRNFAIQKAEHDWIAVTDAGCVLEPTWLQELLKKHLQTKAVVVAGYYRAESQSPFEEAVAPYVLVMPDAVDPDHFLPATRSVLFHKQTVLDLGGFDESLAVSEDYALAQKLYRRGVQMVFTKEAVVLWRPRSSLADFFIMVVSMSRGDVVAGVLRKKAVLVLTRYALGVFWLVIIAQYSALLASCAALLVVAAYVIWAVLKNKKYAPRGFYYLPVLQMTADLGVMVGLVQGFLKRLQKSR